MASTVVSSRMLAAIANDHGAQHVETLTGFKWLSRADVGLPGCTLVYAYEEAIGHCVDPGAVRDKDGISAAVLACDLVAALRNQGRTVLDALENLHRMDKDFLRELLVKHKSGLEILAGSEQFERPGAQDSGAVEELFRVLSKSHDYVVVDAGNQVTSSSIAACSPPERPADVSSGATRIAFAAER